MKIKFLITLIILSLILNVKAEDLADAVSKCESIVDRVYETPLAKKLAINKIRDIIKLNQSDFKKVQKLNTYIQNLKKKISVKNITRHQKINAIDSNLIMQWSFINKAGDVVISSKKKYQNLYPFSQEYAAVQYNELWGFINKKGKFIIPLTFQDVCKPGFTCDYAGVKKDNKWGFINKRGNFVIKAIYDKIQPFYYNIAQVKKNGRWAFINKKGVLLTEYIFDLPSYGFSENYAPVRLNQKWGFIDKTGKFLIKPKYDYAYIFSEDMAAVKVDGKWGFINKKDQMVIEPVFEDAQPFFFDLAKAS